MFRWGLGLGIERATYYSDLLHLSVHKAAVAMIFARVAGLLHWYMLIQLNHNEFGFKSGYSTTLCTVHWNSKGRYIKQSSDIYACLIDAFKAFDTVNHCVLFKKLLTRGISIPIVRFFLHWYCICSVFTGMVLTLLSFLVAMVSVRAVCSAQSCLMSMLTVFSVPCVNQVVVVTGTVYLQVHYATLMTSRFCRHQLTVWEKCWKYVRNFLAHTMFVSTLPKLS